MIRHPNAWQRARAEIDQARAQNGICGDSVVTYADAQRLPYLQACFKEALRIFAPVAMGTPRVVPPEGVTLGGRFFPAGTTVSLNSFSMNLSTEVWGPDAREFRPERWMEASAEQLKNMKATMFQFGAGARTCIGKNVSLLEVYKLVPSFLRRFEVCCAWSWSWWICAACTD